MKVLLAALEGPLGPPNGLNLLVRGTLEGVAAAHEVRLLSCEPAGAPAAATGALPPGVEARAVPAPRRGLARNALAWAAATARRRPWQVAGVEHALRRPLLEEVASFRPDVVHVVSGRLGGLGADLTGLPTVLTAIDAWHLNADAAVAAAAGPRRLALRAEAAAVRRFEATAFARFDRVAVLTERDRDELRAVAPALPLTVVPHGVDAERFRPPPGTQRDPASIVLHGVLSYPPNVTAARTLVEDVLPRVRRSVPEATVTLVGRSPAPAVQALAAVDGVTVTGDVDDVAPWLAAAAVYACPMSTGGGVKNKVLEAMASETPCVVTDVAVQGLDVTRGTHALVEADADAFADALVAVLQDPALARRLGEAGAALVRSAHGWTAVGAAYAALYGEVVAERGAPVG